MRTAVALKNKILARDGILAHSREVAVIFGAYFLYMYVRKIIMPSADVHGIENAVKITNFQDAAGFLWEPAWQSWALDAGRWLVTLFNYLYIFTFFPIILTTALIIYIRDRDRYFYYRGLIMLSFVAALTIFAVFPLAPPRMIGGFFDTISLYGPPWYASREAANYYNAFAAMPSLHFSWTVVFGVLFFRMRHPLLKTLGVLYPTLTFFAITITGNHYIMDAIVGVFMMLVVFLAYEGIRRRKIIAERAAGLIRSRSTVS